MDARRLLSLVHVVTGLLAAPIAAIAVGARERRAAAGRGLTGQPAVRLMTAVVIGAVVLVSVGIALTLD